MFGLASAASCFCFRWCWLEIANHTIEMYSFQIAAHRQKKIHSCELRMAKEIWIEPWANKQAVYCLKWLSSPKYIKQNQSIEIIQFAREKVDVNIVISNNVHSIGLLFPSFSTILIKFSVFKLNSSIYCASIRSVTWPRADDSYVLPSCHIECVLLEAGDCHVKFQPAFPSCVFIAFIALLLRTM